MFPYVSNFNSRISGFFCEVDENCALLGHYVASSGNFLSTFRDNLSFPSSRVGPIGNNPEERGSRLFSSLDFQLKHLLSPLNFHLIYKLLG